MADYITRDGTHTLGGHRSRRFVAFVVLCLMGLPALIAVLAGVLGGPAAAAIAFVTSLCVVTAAVSVHFHFRARRLADDRARRLRFESAAAAASRALLKRDVADPVGAALTALVEGADVETVFLETNTDDEPDADGNTQSVRDILHRGSGEHDPGRWELSGWRIAGPARQSLGAGEAFVTQISRLDPMTLAFYRASGIQAELLVPITTEGRWVGSVGFTSSDRDRQWAADEEQLLRLAAEMIGAYWERRDNQARVEELVRTKDEFIASVSHEVRTPLTAVLGFAHELNEDPDKFSAQELTDVIELIATQSQEVANIVDDLLIAARAEAGTIVIAPRDVSVRAVVGDVLASHSGRVDFGMSTADDLGIHADPGRVRQILRNLLSNADRYGGNIVKILVRSAAARVVIEVRDNGEGIPLRQRDQVFEPYARAQRGSQEPASVGLGLAVARKLAELMDGTIELSRDSGWTVFSLVLPAAVLVVPDEVAAVKQPVGML